MSVEFSSVALLSDPGHGPPLALFPCSVSGYLPCLPDHDVVTVPVPNAQHVGGHAVPSTGQGELLDGLVQGISIQGKKEGKRIYLGLQYCPTERCRRREGSLCSLEAQLPPRFTKMSCNKSITEGI